MMHGIDNMLVAIFVAGSCWYIVHWYRRILDVIKHAFAGAGQNAMVEETEEGLGHASR